MRKTRDIQKAKPKLGYKIFVRYIRLLHDQLYYRKVYTVDSENIPADAPLVVVSNHQNSMCDPLALLLSIYANKKRKVRVITRGGIFQKPLANRFLRWLGLLPAYRLSVDGDASFCHNKETFDEVENELLNDGTIIIFPEGMHQDKHWLGEFSSGYLKMAFEAAEASNFEKEIFILPACNHYSNYFNARENMLIKFGEPISIKPFYELYKTKPRTAQRQVNAIVRNRVANLMLNIEDLENYEAIEFLRKTYGVRYAKNNGAVPEDLSEKLLSDQALISQISRIKEHDPDAMKEIFDKTLELKRAEKTLHVKDKDFDRKSPAWTHLFKNAFFLLFFPLFCFSVVANALILGVPKIFTRKIKDKMFKSAVKFLISVVTVPITCFLVFVAVRHLTHSLFFSLMGMIFIPSLSIFAIYYRKGFMAWSHQMQFLRLKRRGKLDHLFALRSEIYDALDNLLAVDAQSRIFISEEAGDGLEYEQTAIPVLNRI